MSYDIFYGKQFIKLQDTGEVIPLFLSGSNNCYEISPSGGNGRRSRSWSNMNYYNGDHKLSSKPETILLNLDAELQKMFSRHDGNTEYYDKTEPDEIKKHFGYYSSIVVGCGSCADTSWDRWRSQFSNGIKYAKTIEELNELGVNPYLHTLDYEGYEGAPKEVYLKTEAEYFIELQKWEDWKTRSGKDFWISFTPLDTDTVLKRLHQENTKESKPKVEVKQDHYFVLSDGSNALIRYTSRGFKYAYNTSSGKKFRTESEAEKYRQQLIEKKLYKADIWKVEKINQPCSFLETVKPVSKHEQALKDFTQQEKEKEELITSGRFVRCSALWHPPEDKVKVIFQGKDSEKAYFMNRATYHTIPYTVNATIEDYQAKGEITECRTLDIYDPENEPVKELEPAAPFSRETGSGIKQVTFSGMAVCGKKKKVTANQSTFPFDMGC